MEMKFMAGQITISGGLLNEVDEQAKREQRNRAEILGVAVRLSVTKPIAAR